jgi:predicted RND superfamily exporter protein
MSWNRENIFSWIARISCTRFRLLILGTVMVAALCAFKITRLPFQSDVLSLLPENAPQTGAFRKFLKEFGSSDSLLIVLESKSGKEVESFAPFAELLAERLMGTGEFTEIIGRMDGKVKEKMARQLLGKALLYLPEEDLKILEGRLSDEGIERQVHFLKARLSSMFSSPLAVYDPLELFPLFRKNLALGSFGPDLDLSGYLLSPDRKMILLIGKPRGSAPDVKYDQMLVRKIRAAELSAREAFSQGGKIPPAAFLFDLRMGVAGGFIHALEDSRTIKRDLLLNFSISLLGVLFLMVLAFRSGISILYGFFPLLVSPLLTLGLFSPFLGQFSESTGAFSAIILGLSVDFIILLYARFLEEKQTGAGISPALQKGLTGIGPGILTGALTTTGAYYALLLSDFGGVRELGLLTGTGILVSLGCALFLFPALVFWRERKKAGDLESKTMASFCGLERLSTFSLEHPRVVMILCAAITLGLVARPLPVKLNNDPKRLRPGSLPSAVLEERVREKMGEGLETLVVMAKRKRFEEALEVQGVWRNVFAQGKSSGPSVSRFETLARFIPPLSQQQKNLKWVESRGKRAWNPDRVEEKLREALHREGFRIEPFEPAITALRGMLANRELLTWEQVEASPLKRVGERFWKKQGDSFLTVAYLHVLPNFWRGPGSEEFVESIRKSAPGTQVISPKLVQRELEDLMTGEAWKIFLLALAVVSALIYWDFRSWRFTFLGLLPVVLASLWTLGFMEILEIDLNFMNLIVFTMVLGIGVDYAVHILHRSRQSTSGRLAADLEQVGKGVVLSALTTLVGFGSLALSSYPGLRSMGVVTLMSVGFSLLIALTLIPACLRKWLPRRRSF